MATKALVSIEEYLRTSYPDLDKEYVDGEIVVRSLPTNAHSEVQWRLCGIFFLLSQRLAVHGRPELRSRVRDTRVRIPDVAVYAGEKPAEQVPTVPPLIAIEILSPDERIKTLLQKFEEYRAWGVKHVWLVDPEERKLWAYRGGLLEVSAFELPEFNVTITPAEIFG